MNLKTFVVFAGFSILACGNKQTQTAGSIPEGLITLSDGPQVNSPVDLLPANQIRLVVGAERWDLVLSAVAGKKVACVVNHTSLSEGQHLVDRLLGAGVNVVKVFAPEHGFRGLASDGEKIVDEVDRRTGLPIISLYGKTKRPSKEMLEGVDLVVFDIQDVGLRFYTYISTMHYVMDAAAEFGKEVLILDRPNPNGRLVDGPVLEPAFQSFIGMHPIPVAHGMSIGELAQMINGEKWLSEQREVALQVIQVENYEIGDIYELPLKPSPNLPTQNSIYHYPTLCFFEGTVASVGRGTDMPFEVVGHPKYAKLDFAFTPAFRAGASYAPLKGEVCYGIDLRNDTLSQPPTKIDWNFIRDFARATEVSTFIDRPAHFDALAGGKSLRQWMEGHTSEASFRESYRADIQQFLEQRKPYLLYARSTN